PASGGIVAGDPLPLDTDRWAEERQYLRNDTGAALAALRKRRQETLAFLRRLTPVQWQRGSIHATLGRMTFDDWVTLIAAHDDNHLSQLERALDARTYTGVSVRAAAPLTLRSGVSSGLTRHEDRRQRQERDARLRV